MERLRAREALLLVGHGSRKKGFDASMKKLASALKKDGGFEKICLAYLEIAPPSVERAIDDLAHSGAREIRVLPYFLQAGRHAGEDVPRAVKNARRKYRGKVRLRLCPYLGFHKNLVEVVKERAAQAR